MRGTYKIKIAYTAFHIPGLFQVDGTFCAVASGAQYLRLLLDSKLLYTKHLRTVTNKTTRHLCKHLPPTPSRLYDFTENQIHPL